jgi:3-dehydroquinate dehydratase II
MRILVMHGPNLNMLGQREAAVYGSSTLSDINLALVTQGDELGVEIETFQSNHEGELVDKLHESKGRVDGVVINPAAFTHTSIALRDAFLAVSIPFVEVHISNVYSREPFRHKSLLSDVAIGVVAGFGPLSYTMGLEGLLGYLSNES